MKAKVLQSGSSNFIRHVVAVTCAILLVSADGLLLACAKPEPPAAVAEGRAAEPTETAAVAQDAPLIPPDQLDSLVAPIALYPDPLLSQTLVASTYPLELMQLQQWLDRNRGLKDKALADAAAKQPWDPSIQAMAATPDVVKRLTDDIQWATDLGNAFLAQQSDLMDAVQRMRQKAQGTGALQSTSQQKVEVQTVESKSVIVIEPSSPEVVYVPSYNPEVVYGAPVYPYPPIYYPPYTPGVVAASAISFGVGWAMGAAWGGGGWGWNCGWGHNDININNNNNFVRNSNINNIQGGNRINNGGNRANIGGNGNRWQHNPTHRGGAPYPDQRTANRFGGTARGDSLAKRQNSARQQIGRQGGNVGNNRTGADRSSHARVDNRAGANSGRTGGASDRSRTASASDRSRSSGVAGDRTDRKGASDRANTPRASDRSAGGANNRPSSSSNRGGGGDRVGSRDIGRSSGSSRSPFGSGGLSGASARDSSSRGAASIRSSGGGGSRGGGGMSRGGGGGMSRGGGSRGGGGRRR